MSFKCLEHFRWTVWNYLMLYALGAWYLVQELVLRHKKPTAGIMFWPEETTEDGYESHCSVNYLGHFLLTHLLCPVLKTSSSPKNPSRVVNLTSSVHYIGSINFDDLASRKCYSAQAAYAQSKLAQMMFTVMLNKLEKMSGGNILVNAVHPGVVATELFQHVAWN